MTITLKNVTKIIGGNTVADSVNLTLKSGTVYGLCGYNGCGKTMLMRLISGLILPTKGDIFFDEKKLGKDIDFPENMGILIENPAFLGGLSGFDNLKLLASIKGKITDDIIKKTISRVGLDPDDKKKYRKYSLGMKQRLGIASAIMEAPELIILDEPTNALDSSGVEIVKKIIASEKKRGALITVTCHDHAILQEMCDIIYKIEHGKIIDEQVQKLMLEEFLSYDKLTHISRDSSGRVTSISTNSVLINNFANNLDIEIGEIIDSTDSVKNELYLSSLIGFDMLSGVGPKIPIRFQPVSVTHADRSHVFEEAGINQTIHTIILIISVDIQIMLPLAYSTITVKSEMPIAQTLIVGTVPETYFNKK